eukprot:190792-Prorocentrum_minimum.AAC.1
MVQQQPQPELAGCLPDLKHASVLPRASLQKYELSLCSVVQRLIDRRAFPRMGPQTSISSKCVLHKLREVY